MNMAVSEALDTFGAILSKSVSGLGKKTAPKKYIRTYMAV